MPNPVARTAAEIAELHPELSVGTSVTVYPDWSREFPGERPYGRTGEIARHARNGYVVVTEDAGGECHYDPRDVVPTA